MRTKTPMNQESPAGLLVVDSGNRPVYANAEAIRVLAYPEDAENKSSGSYLEEKIRSVVLNGEGTACLPSARDFVSGRRQYRCRSFVLESNVLKSTSNKTAARIVCFLTADHV